MKKCYGTLATLIGVAPLLFAETNALIEVKFFKDWMIKEERTFANLAIKNTGTDPILLAKDAFDFEEGQLTSRLFSNTSTQKADSMRNEFYGYITQGGKGFFELPLGETHVYDGRKFYLPVPATGEKFVVSVYLGKDFWLDSEPLTLNEVTPDSEEKVTTIQDRVNTHILFDLVAVTCKNERWLYTKTLPNERTRSAGCIYYSICPISLMNKIRVEPHGDRNLFKIWDGDKSMIYNMGLGSISDAPDENDVLGKWTRERKQKADADNAEVRRKKAEEAK